MTVLVAKVVSMALLGGVSILVGLVPLAFKRYCGFASRRSQLLISALTCFGGGVILTTCFTHMMPKVNIFLKKNIKHGAFPETGLHMAEVFVLCGFFLVYFTEEVTHLAINRYISRRKQPECCLNANQNGEESQPALIEKQIGDQPQNHENTALEFMCKRDATTFEATLRGFLVILALSLHAVFEGIALGLTATESSVWYLFVAIASHKFVISFCVGMQFVSSGVKTVLTIIFITTFSVISPIGAGIGLAITETVTSEASLHSTAVTILQGLASGTLLYVVFFEVIEKERLKKTNGLLMLAFIVLGAATMTVVQYIEVLSGSHH